MNKFWATLLILFSSLFSSFSQQKEDISMLLKQVKEASYYDSARLFKAGENVIKIANELSNQAAVAEVHLYYGNYFFYTRNLDQSKKYFEQSLTESKKTDNSHLQVLAQIRLSYLEYEVGDKEIGLKELENLFLLSKKTKDYENLAELYNLLGIIKEETNKLQDAAKLYMEGLALSESKNLLYYPAVFQNNLGLIKYYSGQPDDAVEDFKRGLETAKKENNKRLISHIQINLCVFYVGKNKLNEATVILREVLRYFRENNLPEELASAFINFGAAFDNPSAAIPYTDSAIVVLKKHNLNRELTKAYLTKSDLLIQLKKDKDAFSVLEEAKLLAKKTGSLDDIASCYQLSYRIQTFRKNYKEALDAYTSYIQTKDSLDKNQTGKVIKEMQLKYNVQKKETELEKEKTKTIILEKINQEERFKRWLTVGIALTLLLVLMIAFYLRYLRKLREQQEHFSRQLIENTEKERLRIARDLHDDIGQSLSMIKSKISAGKTETSQNLEGELGRVIEQTREISKNLYPSYLEKIGLVRSVARLVENIQASTKLECSFEVADDVDQLPINTKTHLYRILQECVNNTIKHSGASALKISITKKNDEFELIYQDNGKGIEDQKEINGIGMFSIKERAKIIHGTLHFNDKNQKGFKLILKFRN